MAWPIAIGGPAQCEYSRETAQEVLAGYAFGIDNLDWRKPKSAPDRSPLGPPPKATSRSRWVYRSFDCVPASRDPGLSIEDIVITAAINSQIGSRAILGMMAIGDDIRDVLFAIPLTLTFWDLLPEDVGSEPPPPAAVAWNVWRAWELLMGLPSVGLAVAHKTLHHKRPWLFPMLDNKTSKAMGGEKSNLWSTIHRDLLEHVTEFEYLETWFADLASHENGRRLTRLRIHDILIWAHATDNRCFLTSDGKKLLRQRV